MNARRFPDAGSNMPTDAELKAEKTLQIGSRMASDFATGNVIPRLPFRAIPPKMTKAFPDLSEWHKSNHGALEEWREKLNIVVARKTSELQAQTKSGLEALQADTQTQLDAAQTQLAAAQVQINYLLTFVPPMP